MKIERVGFTDTVMDIIKRYADNAGTEAKEYCLQLADVISNKIPKGKYKIDASDDALTFAGVPLSFLRVWDKGEAYIMTIAEATALDNNTKSTHMWITL